MTKQEIDNKFTNLFFDTLKKYGIIPEQIMDANLEYNKEQRKSYYGKIYYNLKKNMLTGMSKIMEIEKEVHRLMQRVI